MYDEGVAVNLDARAEPAQEPHRVLHMPGVGQATYHAGALGERGEDQGAVRVVLGVGDADLTGQRLTGPFDKKVHMWRFPYPGYGTAGRAMGG